MLVLASQSTARASMLRNAGINFTIDAADLDEAAIRDRVRAQGGDAAAAAKALADEKAIQVSLRHGGALVIGADQILDCAGDWFDKPLDIEAARRDLMVLRGRDHHQCTAVSVARDGATLWRHGAAARLTMRAFSQRFLDDLLAEVGDKALASAGAYQLEGSGVQLFSTIEGDYFTILGLPLLPLLMFLRSQGEAGQ